MCEWGTDRTVAITRRVTVDACLADAIVALNAAGVATTGCCCGHGKPGTRPSATILPSAQGRARELGYEVTKAPSGAPMIWLPAPSPEPDTFADLHVRITHTPRGYRVVVHNNLSDRETVAEAHGATTPWLALLRALKEMSDTNPEPARPEDLPHAK